MGIETDLKHIYSSAYLASIYLFEEEHLSSIFVVGADALREELHEKGLNIVDRPPADILLVGL